MVAMTMLLGSATVLALAAGAARADPKTDGRWRGSGGAALAAASGNTSSSSVQLDGEMRWATGADRVLLNAKVHRASSRQQGKTTTAASKWSTSGEYGHNLSDRSYAFGKLALESDKLIALSRRRSLAAGVGYQLVRRPHTSSQGSMSSSVPNSRKGTRGLGTPRGANDDRPPASRGAPVGWKDHAKQFHARAGADLGCAGS